MTATWAPVHPQVIASEGMVDERIAPLLEALWARGLETEFSCQGDSTKLAHIAFRSVSDAEMFAASSMGVDFQRVPRSRWVDFPSSAIDHLTKVWSTA